MEEYSTKLMLSSRQGQEQDFSEILMTRVRYKHVALDTYGCKQPLSLSCILGPLSTTYPRPVI